MNAFCFDTKIQVFYQFKTLAILVPRKKNNPFEAMFRCQKKKVFEFSIKSIRAHLLESPPTDTLLKCTDK